MDIEWPRETRKDASDNLVVVPLAKVPDASSIRMLRLAMISVDAAGVVTFKGDCRKQFAPLAH
jgi:hypothetical protein